MFFAFDDIVTSRGGFIVRVRGEEVVWIGLYSGLFRFLGLGFRLRLNGWVGGFVGIGGSDRGSLVFSLSSFGFLRSVHLARDIW